MKFMILLLLNLMLMISSMMFMQLKHPLAMGFILIIQTILISMITGLMINSFWFSYILFLVFLGGMLVLFIYVTSLASNEMFNFSTNMVFIYLSILMLNIMIMILTDPMNFLLSFNYECLNMKFYEILNENSSTMIFKLYNFPTNWLTCLMINYLFFTLIVVVKVTNFFYGPIRNLN
uniref:NADH-ubiquinone oxidoreductase chain 6 n=1 Tax=Bradysia impatiens TaxID=335710 RepID=A0A8F3BVQ1_9DIPT|nr:NADH deshydrogenase subunit 6 [Bradysia impatiens]